MSKKTALRLFITDDDPDDREFIKRSLQESGYRGSVSEFDNGNDLCKHLTKYPKQLPSLILLDLNMPVKNGYDTLRELKSNPKLQDIPVMVLTVSAKKEDKAACLELGAGYFHTKPFKSRDYLNLALSIMVVAAY